MKLVEAVGFIFLKGNKVLLEKRWEHEDNYAGILAVPGGHVGKREKLENVAVREAQEELEVKVTELEFVASLKDFDKTSKHWYLLHYFLCKEWLGEISETTEQEAIKWQQ